VIVRYRSGPVFCCDVAAKNQTEARELARQKAFQNGFRGKPKAMKCRPVAAIEEKIGHG
jgi:hypothetical protein